MPNGQPELKAARTFAAYLGSPLLPLEIAERYASATAAWSDAPRDRFDAWLANVAAVHPLLTSLADTYARVARPYGDLRRRLTLMLALLETHGATHDVYDRARPSSAAAAWAALVATGLLWAVRALLATIFCVPAHILLRARTLSRRSA